MNLSDNINARNDTAFAGAFCRARGLAGAEFCGADAAAFLQGQLTCNTEALAAGAWRRAAHCSRQGRVLANGVLGRLAAERFVFVVCADVRDAWAAEVRKFILRAKVQVALPNLHFFGEEFSAGGGGGGGGGGENNNGKILQTENSAAICGDGWRLHFAEELPAEISSDNGDNDAWTRGEILRGAPWIGAATQGEFIPQFINLEKLGGVDFDKGCYVGQEIIARLHYRGEVKQRGYILRGAGAPPAAGAAVVAGGKPAGAVVNSAADESGGGYIAFAAVKTSALNSGDALQINGADVAEISPPPYSL